MNVMDAIQYVLLCMVWQQCTNTQLATPEGEVYLRTTDHQLGLGYIDYG